jgi:hypothetical protein
VNKAAGFFILSFLFGLRVLGQAVQRWFPVSFLPSFDAFQGSRLPYSVLLSAQIIIFGGMLAVCRRALSGSLEPNVRRGFAIALVGTIYMTGSILRIVIGLLLPTASHWFRAWIPGFFHLVLAAFVLLLARAYRSP